jgi:hypothetical protein
MKNNVVGWFEIPVSDMVRAIRFYETVFGFEMTRQTILDEDMAFFPFVETGQGSSGGLVCHPEYTPSDKGVVIYFTAQSGDLATELSRVDTAGGKVLMSKKLITEEIGYMGLFLDTEGNRIALHSRS